MSNPKLSLFRKKIESLISFLLCHEATAIPKLCTCRRKSGGPSDFGITGFYCIWFYTTNNTIKSFKRQAAVTHLACRQGQPLPRGTLHPSRQMEILEEKNFTHRRLRTALFYLQFWKKMDFFLPVLMTTTIVVPDNLW